MELFSHVRLAFNPRISPTSCAGAVPSASAVSIVFLPPRCSRSVTCSRWLTCLPVHAKRQTASRTLRFPLWHPVSPSTIRCRQARQRSILCSCPLAFSSRYAHVGPLRGADGPASSPCVSRGCRPPDTLAVIDRHYNSPVAYQPPQPSIFAVRVGNALQLRLTEFENNRLILRPIELDHPVQLLALGPHEMPSDLIIGRVCLILAPIP